MASAAGINSTKVAAIQVGSAAELAAQLEHSNRMANTELGIVVADSVDDDLMVEALRQYLESGVSQTILVLGKRGSTWSLQWIGYQGDRNSTIAKELAQRFGVAANKVKASATFRRRAPEHPLVVDTRVSRMLRLSVKSRQAVMLVGPPGTGKTQMVAEITEEIARDPRSYGMTTVHDPLFVTPDESWTTRELVGGDTVDDKGKICFSPGHVLEAIAQDRWLVLDEANRADLDRIFGGLLTWLSGQAVIVGRVSADPRSSPIVLDWNEKPYSEVVGRDRLRGKYVSPEPIIYKAGTDWRILGTYNAVDAQRVFRFGEALGRRFGHVPVGAPDDISFSVALRSRIAKTKWALSKKDADRIHEILGVIYSAHFNYLDPMGPAALLSIPDYVSAGLQETSDSEIPRLIAEAYLAGMGSWLALYDRDERMEDVAEVVGSDDVLGGEWEWLRGQLKTLR
ncbi:AAA domain (dynein-related subfamily) [Amycolatopsis regifaucium]|nr:AAA domain (dynein-related subfamily) [Amycolatopsis regifaucium]